MEFKKGVHGRLFNNRLSWFIDYSFSLCLTWRYGYLFVSTTLRWGFWTHTIFGPGWWVYMYKQWKSDVKCPWITLEVDAEVLSVRELTVFWLFLFIQAGNTPLHYAASSGLYQCVQVCTVFTLLAVSFFPHSWLVSRLKTAFLLASCNWSANQTNYSYFLRIRTGKNAY